MAVYYIGSVRCQEVKSFAGSILTQDDAVVWLGESEGYPSAKINKFSAKRFDKPEAVKTYAVRADGMPWYYRFKEGSLRIYKVTRIVTETYDEVEVTEKNV